MLKRLRSLSVLVVIAGGLTAAPAIAEDHATADTVVATVDGTEITLGHMITLRAGLPAQFASLPTEILYQGILDQLIQQAILVNSFEGEMSKRGKLALENERRAVISSEILDQIGGDAVTEEAVQAAYDLQYLQAAAETEYRAAHILVETQEKAAELSEMLKNGADFATLARENSTGPSGPSGGELGWFTADLMVQPFSDAVKTMEIGQISDPVQTQFGWHVIALNETRSKDRPALDVVRPEIEDAIRQEATDARIAQLSETVVIDRTTGDALDPALLDQNELLDD